MKSENENSVSIVMMTTFSGSAFKGPRMPSLINEMENKNIFSDALGIWNKEDKTIYTHELKRRIKGSFGVRFCFKIVPQVLDFMKIHYSKYILYENIFYFFTSMYRCEGKFALLKPRPYKLVKKIKAQNKIVIIEASENHPRFTQQVLLKECNKIGINVPDNPYTSEKSINEYEKSIALADYLICLSSFSAQTYIAQGFPKDHIYIACPTYKSEKKLVEIKKKKPIKFVCVGFHGILKGTHRLVNCWIKNCIKNELVIIGPLYDDLKEYLKNIELPENIIFLGNKNREWILNYLSNERFVGVLLSFSEAFGRAAYEYMIAGGPVIVSPTCISDIIKPKYNGIVVNPDDEESLKNAVYKFCEMSEEEFEKMRNNAWQSCNSDNLELFEKKYTDCLKDIIEIESMRNGCMQI